MRGGGTLLLVPIIFQFLAPLASTAARRICGEGFMTLDTTAAGGWNLG